MGEMESPCRMLLSCLRGFPGVPLRRILDEEVVKAMLI
jgi:hypothetical protein